MNHCKDCRHFGEEIKDFAGVGDEIWDTPTGYHVCDYIKHTDKNLHVVTANAVLQDGSGYWAGLCVRDDFGCVNFEAKE